MKLGFLYKSDMTLSQQNELNQLNNFIFDYILDTFGHKTVTNKTFKTNYGFRILRSCHNRKKKCRAKWTVKINIGQYEAQLNSQNKCDHLIGLNQSSIYNNLLNHNLKDNSVLYLNSPKFMLKC